MHHAAMANKREMMMTVARLGCDYRARADGIDGATATFVLCGQHGKSSQQQRGLELMLKKCFKEGVSARATGHPSLGTATTVQQDLRGDAVATSDAAMLSLLEEEDLLQRKESKRKKKRRTKSDAEATCATAAKTTDASSSSQNGHASRSTAASGCHKKERENAQTAERSSDCLPVTANSVNSSDAKSKTRVPKSGGNDSLPAGSVSSVPSPLQGAAETVQGRVRCDPCAVKSVAPESGGPAVAEADLARAALEQGVMSAAALLDGGVAAVKEDSVSEALGQLDLAIAKAVSMAVSAKYAKKVRRRLAARMQSAEGQSSMSHQPPETVAKPGIDTDTATSPQITSSSINSSASPAQASEPLDDNSVVQGKQCSEFQALPGDAASSDGRLHQPPHTRGRRHQRNEAIEHCLPTQNTQKPSIHSPMVLSQGRPLQPVRVHAVSSKPPCNMKPSGGLDKLSSEQQAKSHHQQQLSQPALKSNWQQKPIEHQFSNEEVSAHLGSQLGTQPMQQQDMRPCEALRFEEYPPLGYAPLPLVSPHHRMPQLQHLPQRQGSNNLEPQQRQQPQQQQQHHFARQAVPCGPLVVESSRRSSASFSSDPVVVSPMACHLSDTIPARHLGGPSSLCPSAAADMGPGRKTPPIASPSLSADTLFAQTQPNSAEGRANLTSAAWPAGQAFEPSIVSSSALGSLSMTAFAQQQAQNAQQAQHTRKSSESMANHGRMPSRQPPPGFSATTQGPLCVANHFPRPNPTLRIPPGFSASSADAAALPPVHLDAALLPSSEDACGLDADSEADEHISRNMLSSLFDDDGALPLPAASTRQCSSLRTTGSSSERLSCAPPYNRMQLPLPHPGNRNSFDDARVSAAPLEQSDLIRHSLDGDQRQIWGPAATALVLQQQWVSPGVHTSSASGLHGSPRAAYHPGISHPTPETYRSGSPLQRHQHQHHEVHQEQKPEHESHSQAHRHFSLSSATGDDQWKYSATQFAAVGSLWGDKGFHESFAVDSVPVASSAPQSGDH